MNLAKMVEEYAVTGYENFIAKIQELEKAGREVYCVFSGSKDANGKSWCPDCVTAEPVIRGCLKNMPEGSVFVYCQVGERAYWKDKSNDFRTNPKMKLTGVPTLMKWGSPNQKLVEENLFKPDMINMMFED